MGSAPLLVQCFSNLIGNAVKFVPAERRPEVRVYSEPSGDGRVRLWVEDNGIGIAREDYSRIFGLFQRLEKKFEGTGIGLAIVRRAGRYARLPHRSKLRRFRPTQGRRRYSRIPKITFLNGMAPD